MTGFKSKWIIVEGGLFSPARVPEIILAHRISAYSAYDGPDCAIVVVHNPRDHATLRSQKYEEMEVPKPKPAAVGTCKHRGKESGTAKCPTCKGNIRVKLFDCAVHGQCTLMKNIKVERTGTEGKKVLVELPVCDLCPDRESANQQDGSRSG